MSEQRTRPVVYAVWLIFASVVGWFAAFQLLTEKLASSRIPTRCPTAT